MFNWEVLTADVCWKEDLVKLEENVSLFKTWLLKYFVWSKVDVLLTTMNLTRTEPWKMLSSTVIHNEGTFFATVCGLPVFVSLLKEAEIVTTCFSGSIDSKFGSWDWDNCLLTFSANIYKWSDLHILNVHINNEQILCCKVLLIINNFVTFS